MKTRLQLILESIDKDPLLSSGEKAKREKKMDEAVSAAVHIVQGFAHEAATHLVDKNSEDPEEEYINVITEFVDKVKDNLMTSHLEHPKHVDLKTIAGEFAKVFKDDHESSHDLNE